MSALLFLFLFSLQGGQSAIVCTVTAGGAPVAGAEIVVAGKTYVTDRAAKCGLTSTRAPSS